MARLGRRQPNPPVIKSNTGRLGTFPVPSPHAIVVTDTQQRRRFYRQSANVTTIINASVEVITGAQPGTTVAIVVNVTAVKTSKRLFSQGFNTHTITREYATAPFALPPVQPIQESPDATRAAIVSRLRSFVNRTVLQRNPAVPPPSVPTPNAKVILAVQHRSRLLSRTRVPAIIIHNGAQVPATKGTVPIVVEVELRNSRIRSTRSRVSVVLQGRAGLTPPPAQPPHIGLATQTPTVYLRLRWKSVATVSRNPHDIGPLWLFPSPQIYRINYPLETEPVFSLWTRVHRGVPSTVIRNSNGVWEEWIGPYPWTENPRNKYLFGPRGFETMGTDQSAWSAPQRLYLGGRTYVIDDILAEELMNAVTTNAPTGYGTYITLAPPGSVFTGDEILLSGYASDIGGTGIQAYKVV